MTNFSANFFPFEEIQEREKKKTLCAVKQLYEIEFMQRLSLSFCYYFESSAMPNMKYGKVICAKNLLRKFRCDTHRDTDTQTHIQKKQHQKIQNDTEKNGPTKLIGYNLFETHYVIVNKIETITVLFHF